MQFRVIFKLIHFILEFLKWPLLRIQTSPMFRPYPEVKPSSGSLNPRTAPCYSFRTTWAPRDRRNWDNNNNSFNSNHILEKVIINMNEIRRLKDSLAVLLIKNIICYRHHSHRQPRSTRPIPNVNLINTNQQDLYRPTVHIITFVHTSLLLFIWLFLIICWCYNGRNQNVSAHLEDWDNNNNISFHLNNFRSE